MISHASRSFWERFSTLPKEIQEQARATYILFLKDPEHPSLSFKKLHGRSSFWSVRITRKYRAVAVKEDDTLLWFWIGSHARFDRDFG